MTTVCRRLLTTRFFCESRQPSGMNNACIGFANGVDTVMVNRYLAMAEDVLPQGFRGLWTVKPSEYVQGANIYELVAIKATSRDGKAPLDGGVVTDASVEFDGGRQGGSGAPHVSMTMNAEGASAWAHLTKDNIGKQIAIPRCGARAGRRRACRPARP